MDADIPVFVSVALGLASVYGVVAIVVIVLGMPVVFLVKPVTRLYSKIMRKRGVTWSFAPNRNVMVVDDDGCRIERDSWGSESSVWSEATEEWMDAVFIAGLIWPYVLFAIVRDRILR